MEKETSRVEAFSDGVFAIAITLLILEIRVPHQTEANSAALLAALGKLWPSALALVFSFFVILLMWINHHELMRLVRGVDSAFLLANGFLLLMITVVPFPTAVLAQYLSTGAANVAAAAYCSTFVLISIAFNLLFASIAWNRRLVRSDIPDALLTKIGRTYRLGFVVYLLAVLLACYNAALGLAVCGSLWLVWTRLSYRGQRHHPAVQ